MGNIRKIIKKTFKIITSNLTLVYIVFGLTMIIMYLIQSLVNKAFPSLWITNGEMGSDYFRQIVYASDLKNIYFNTFDAPFPPFAYLFYHLLYLINPFSAKIELSSWVIARDHTFNKTLFLIKQFIYICVFLFIIYKFLKNQYKINTILIISFIILFSIPFMFKAIYLGNVIFLVVILLITAIYIYIYIIQIINVTRK